MAFLKRLLRALPLLLLSPFLMALSALALALTDLWWKLAGRRDVPVEPGRPAPETASVVIPNWNGKDLLEKYLPSVVEAMAGNEIIVVDNGSQDGSAEFLRAAFPQVKLLALPRNLGFGGGSNAGFRAAANDIVVLLNSDMRVAPDFLAPLLEGFRDPAVFAVSCQIFFSDPAKLREETGLTQGWWQDGGLRVRHRIDAAIDDLFPCFYGGGGSCAFDRRKFLELGGFDPLLAPFYLEDTDLGYLAWKRGWKVLYQPRSVVYHEHRGTIGKTFPRGPHPGRAEEELPAVLLEEHSRVAAPALAFRLRLGGRAAGGDLRRRAGAAEFHGPVARLPPACRAPSARAGARAAWPAISDTEAFLRPLGGYFRDRFDAMEPAPAAPARALRFALSHLPAGAWRRRLHVPDAARRWPGWPKCTWSSCWIGPGRKRTTGNCANSAPRRNGWCAPPARSRARPASEPARRARSSPTRISSG